MADIRDVASRAQCSIATVSRAINSPHLVRPEMLARVLAAVSELRFRPNALGRQLRAERTGLIGVMLPTLANPVFADCIQGIEENVGAADGRLVLVTTQYDPQRERRAIDTLLEQRVDGLLLTLSDATNSPLLDDLNNEGMPHVLMYNDAPTLPAVSVDNYRAARDGVAMLIAAGHRHIAMISGALHTSDRAKRRYAGYRAALDAAGATPLPAWEVDFNAGVLAAPVLDALLRAQPRPTALFCSNDLLALVVMRALRQAAVRVPEDMSIMGFDGLSVGELLSPTLATVSQPSTEIGRQASRRLLMLIGGRPPEYGAMILPHEVRPGGSVCAPGKPA